MLCYQSLNLRKLWSENFMKLWKPLWKAIKIESFQKAESFQVFEKLLETSESFLYNLINTYKVKIIFCIIFFKASRNINVCTNIHCQLCVFETLPCIPMGFKVRTHSKFIQNQLLETLKAFNERFFSNNDISSEFPRATKKNFLCYLQRKLSCHVFLFCVRNKFTSILLFIWYDKHNNLKQKKMLHWTRACVFRWRYGGAENLWLSTALETWIDASNWISNKFLFRFVEIRFSNQSLLWLLECKAGINNHQEVQKLKIVKTSEDAENTSKHPLRSI